MKDLVLEKVPGILNLLVNPNEKLRLEFSHPETLIYQEKE